jgi:hypothetical protein
MMVEMLGALILLTAFALIASRLFYASMRTIDQAGRAQATMTQFDSLLGALRQDVWGARSIEVGPDQRTLVLSGSQEDAEVRWTIDPGVRDADADGFDERAPSVTRSAGAAVARRFAGIGLQMSFVRHDAGVSVRHKDDEVPLFSLIEISRRGGGK